PEQVQFDNARELAGWGTAARTLSRVIRLCLRFGVSPVFIPKGEPQFNGSVEDFNGWFPELLFQRRFRRPGDLRRGTAGAAGTGAAARSGQHAAYPPAAGGPDTGAAPARPAAAEAAWELRGADGPAPSGGGARDVHPARERGRDGHGPEPDLPGGEEASGAV